jgi:hypothetical protein
MGDLHTLAASLAWSAERRGDDSWGVCKIDGTNLSIVKEKGNIKKTCKIRNILAPHVIGHTRKATTGAPTKENAHPFHIGNIIGAHNGFVFDHKELNKKNGTDYEVDSQHLIHHINAGLPIKDISGSGTVSWLNTKEPDSIMLGRGYQSDLTIFVVGSDRKRLGVVWSSIGVWGQDALEMAGFEYITINSKSGTLYKVHKYNVFEVDEFPFSSYKPTSYPDQTGCGAGTYNHAHGYRGNVRGNWLERSSDTQYWEKRAKEMNAKPKHGERVIEIVKDDLDHLPEALKKSPQVGSVASGQDKETATQTTICDGCRVRGESSPSYEANADGIVYCAEAQQLLCYNCFAWWIVDTRETSKQDKRTTVPTLALKMSDARLLR